jgi:hypothetical protein
MVEVDGGAGALPLRVRVRLDRLHPVPEPPYVDPEIVPGMVVAPLDEDDDRVWFVIEGKASGGPFFMPPTHGMLNGCYRHGLPATIRVAFDPREASS